MRYSLAQKNVAGSRLDCRDRSHKREDRGSTRWVPVVDLQYDPLSVSVSVCYWTDAGSLKIGNRSTSQL